MWRIARRGHDLVDARRRVDPDAIRREIAATEANADQPWATGSTMERTMESLRAQLATVERLERVIGDADSRLRLLNARLDEAAARTIELSVQAEDVAELGGLGDDVDADGRRDGSAPPSHRGDRWRHGGGGHRVTEE